jgi:hypothetical protein
VNGLGAISGVTNSAGRSMTGAGFGFGAAAAAARKRSTGLAAGFGAARRG